MEPDRKKAIALAIQEARAGDIVLIAGKGHEKVQVLRHGPVPSMTSRLRARLCSAAGYVCGPEHRPRAAGGALWTAFAAPRCRPRVLRASPDPGAMAAGIFHRFAHLQRGDLFFAVKGERLDGHDYRRGRAGGRRSRSRHAPRPSPAFPRCRPAAASGRHLVALQQLGAAVRRLWGKPLIGITGSAGKTTTKEIIATLLSTRLPRLEVRRAT